MKKLILSMFLFGSISINGISQTNFAQDIHVTTANDYDCTNERVSVAYNGDIYIGRLRKNPDDENYTRWEIVKSTDNGATWTVFKNSIWVPSTTQTTYTSFDMITAGTALANNFRVYVVVGVHLNNTLTGSTSATLDAYCYTASGTQTALSFNTGQNFANGRYKSISLASDWKQKNSSAIDYTVSCAVVKSIPNGLNTNDSIIGFTTQGSLTNFIRRSYYGTTKFIQNVSAAVGSCNSGVSPYGRLGIVWDERQSILVTNPVAHIKALFAFPDNGQIAPNGTVQIIDDNSNSRGKPCIAMSQEAGENDIRTVITYERVYQDYNLVRRVKSNTIIGAAPNFSGSVYISPAGRNSYGAHVVYDPVYNNFLHVYYNATQKTIPYKLTGLNDNPTANPTMPSGNIQDVSGDFVNVNPRVDYVNSSAGAVFVWNESGKTILDYETSTLSIQTDLEEIVSDVKLYPNPASNQMTLNFTTNNFENVHYTITDLTGREVWSEQGNNTSSGENNKSFDVSTFENGHYFLTIIGSNERKSIKFIVNK